ncbi:cupin domain-containing protein [Microbacterium sp. C7(2022)]|uniref:cupin domain-containing protein n=1 Tax=Microbacterium sp. C7(2022) TaxID=2992759 RepID=UPI00237A9242|nr:cupin domain-containing protein [Microbacterium sp. C7(2022)]MDE0546323.1 cupin domain-containing protein [Microbacterium sp. C7(2022)]
MSAITATPDTPATARRLGLEPHPEGGWFRRTWTAQHPISTDNGQRPAATCIHYLLTPGEHSAWHVVSSDEIWLWHGPGTLELSLGGDGDQPGEAARSILGPDAAAGHVAQAVVPAGVWQAARPAGAEEVLVSCVVSPGFSFDDWRLASVN